MEYSKRLKKVIVDFNLFQTHTPLDEDPHQKKIQLWSTRILIFLLVITLFILLVYNAQLEFTRTVTVTTPSLTIYRSLESTYGSALSCPCTQIAVERKKFLDLSPRYHQVCSSAFISDPWLNYLRSAAALYISVDFRYTGSILFTILASFCRLANQTIAQSLPNFYSTRYISSQIVGPDAFEIEMDRIINFYINSTRKAYAEAFELVRDVHYIDGLMPGLSNTFSLMLTDYYPPLSAHMAFPYFANYGSCFCELTPTCILPARISDRFTVPGLYVGCSLVEALRRSNLVCFYNQTCVKELTMQLNSSVVFDATVLIQSNASRFHPSTTISEILDVLMVDAWTINISFDFYYEQCHPSSCTYAITRRHDAIYILTASLGIFGGVYKALFLLIPWICRLIIDYWRKRKIENSDHLPVAVTPQISRKQQAVQWIRSFNLFPSYPPSTDSYRLKTERLMTYIYVILLFISILILLAYNASQTTLQTITIPSPSLIEYRRLHEKYASNSLSCPCSKIAIQHADFLTLTPVYHQLCGSHLLRGAWMTYRNPDKLWYLTFDFRVQGALFMHGFAIYCSLSERTVSNSLAIFLSTSMITSELLTELLFQDRTNQLMLHFTQSLGREFIEQLDLLRINTYGNQIITGMRTNFNILFQGPTSSGTYPVVILPWGMYNNCFCDISSTCSTSMGFYDSAENGFALRFKIPGVRMGCYMNEALRQSTLECFYNRNCTDALKENLALGFAFSHALDSSELSRYSPTTLFADLIDNLMIERWIWNSFYSDYYRVCQPISCSYQITTKPSFLIVITTLLGLIGGLMKVLQVIVPIFVKWIRRLPSANARPRLSLTEYRNKVLEFVRTWNLFRTKTPLDDQPRENRTQILSTRAFATFLLLSLIILLFYNGLVPVIRTKTIDSPSFASYLLFYEQFGDQITCPCTTFVIPQHRFIFITPHLHQICTSDLIDPSWAETIHHSYFYGPTPAYNRDFRFRAPYYFLSLQSFCQLANRSINNALDSFYSSTYVTSELNSRSKFEPQVNASIDLFITSITNAFIQSFRILRDINYGNVLVSATLSSVSLSLSYNGTIRPNDPTTWQISLRYKSYNESSCSCRDTPTCVEPAYIYSFRPYTPLYPVPGIFIGCYTFEALLQSNLMYFYNQTNLDLLSQRLNSTASKPFRALDPSKSDRFALDEPIERILERMMIDRWERNISFEDYFHQCRPILCRYTYRQKFDLLYMITSIIALIGGLTSLLQMIVPSFIRLTLFIIASLKFSS